ncbi:hypothetical protein D3C72_2522340 [compost metagenome]
MISSSRRVENIAKMMISTMGAACGERSARSAKWPMILSISARVGRLSRLFDLATACDLRRV